MDPPYFTQNSKKNLRCFEFVCMGNLWVSKCEKEKSHLAARPSLSISAQEAAYVDVQVMQRNE